MIIVVGGFNNDSQALNDVIMYDTVTGQSQILPSLIYKRSACSAVIANDVINAFGRENIAYKIISTPSNVLPWELKNGENYQA